MDVHKFTYPLMIARELSLSKAAEKLFITPSALSQYITKEEQSLGVQLFTRTREKWVPTCAGQIYLETARQILELNENMERRIQDIADCKTGRFSVGITPGYGTAMFSEVYPRFRKAYPGIQIHLIEGNWKRLQRLMLEDTLDLSFTYLCDTGRELSPGLEAQLLAEEDFALFVPPNHPMAGQARTAGDGAPTVDLSLLGDDSFIGMSKETTLYHATDELFKKAGISPNILFESTSTVTVYNLVRKGLGVAILPYFYARESENAVYFRIRPSLKWSVLAVNRKGYQPSRAMRDFVALAQEFYLQLSEQGGGELGLD